MRRVGGTLLALYFIGRAVAEPFLIDVGDPASYRRDWGGPSLAGVLLVHCGPGVIAAVLLVVAARGWWRARLAVEVDRSRPYRRRAPTRARASRDAGAPGSGSGSGPGSGSPWSAAHRSPHQPR
ncbi:hypothetical protein AMIS_34410 [Actinoplanes missouriensis 431]|uniref:Uncharacterized protein n=1 Tax=Actinoplanes missouriensis (strain ATCC 14538 / DSM 43046 / CBS 188.64 / JCM 3121 / NBRC 102363 / NCIMB 12654 / NRRL B-3342 / UNCC 431) TaxID=512565 RepID=I0H6M4_ACTM4|nr:hypothetical protein [Actinoplanes missouriensis]BAL88661.1 hypothetical protein AMIS_34410 [Actinoplanes missouriensis 431]